MKKKGSLSLSINAIVILVLAITMLGLGLAFTKGMFGKLSSKLSVPEPDIPATPDDPISLPSDELSITKNKQFVFSVNAYNDAFDNGDSVYGRLYCPAGGSADTPVQEIRVCSGPQRLEAGEDKGFKFIIPKDSVKRSATRVCTIAFFDMAVAYDIDSTTGCAEPDDTQYSTIETKQVVVAIK